MIKKAAASFLRNTLLPRVSARTMASLGRLWLAGAWADFQEAAKDPASFQKKRLLTILVRNEDTEFGKQHRFRSIKGPEDYQKAVPVRPWTEFEPQMMRQVHGETNVLTSEKIVYFARTSGTTGTPKYIPVTKSFLEEYLRGRKLWVRQLISEFPEIIRGRALMLHSPFFETTTPSGIPSGSISSFLISINHGVRITQGLPAIPREILGLDDFKAKYYLILRFALESPISMISAVNPSTIVLFCQKLTEYASVLAEDLRRGTISQDFGLALPSVSKLTRGLRPRPAIAEKLLASLSRHGVVKPREIWNSLRLVATWRGGPASFYLGRFSEYFDRLEVMDLGYLATEGNFSVPLPADTSDGALIPHGHYLEFVPESERDRGGEEAVSMEKLEPGGRYYVIVTGSHGLYRYDINDLIECTGYYLRTPRVVFVSKGENVLSITGEKVTEWQIVEAAGAASAAAGVKLAGFACAIRKAATPYYVLIAEPDGPIPESSLKSLLLSFDRDLRRLNIEYEAKRKSLRLGPPLMRLLKPGSFVARREKLVMSGRLDFDGKAAHISHDETIFDDSFVGGGEMRATD